MALRVVVIEGDEWLGSLLARELREKGLTVDVYGEARDGFAKTCAMLPDCVVCSLELPDIDGIWLARRLRTESGPVSKTPIILIGELVDKDARIQAFHAGADVVLARPIANADVVAQVEALMAIPRRMARDTDGPPSSVSSTSAIRGDLAMFPLASLLMMLEMERRTGVVEVVSSSGRRSQLTLAYGLFAATELDRVVGEPIAVLREVLSWRAGRFSYTARDPGAMPEPRGSVGAIVLEAMRLEDEKRVGQ